MTWRQISKAEKARIDREAIGDMRQAARLLQKISRTYGEDPVHFSWNAFELLVTAGIKEAELAGEIKVPA
ncbi:hypothetical protein [Mycobacterium sp. NPDC050853]|uniref:hypothetical protein n=1 Tax=Mycobacterium sp. NPDC050853 TaxID=3155160 RepID=UPI00340C5AC5